MHDCLILGGGVVGLSIAYELAGHGVQVQVIDQSQLGQEASWAGAGILPPANLEMKPGVTCRSKNADTLEPGCHPVTTQS